MKTKTILIFGATGTIGAYTALYLKDKKYNVVASGRRKSDNGFFRKHGITYCHADISKKDEFTVFNEIKPYAIVHCAGIMPATMEGYHPQKYIDSIVTGTLNILEYMCTVKSAKILFTHSRADSNYLMGTRQPVPADIEKKFPLKGDHSIYSICKNTAVDLIEHYYHQYNIQRFIFRLPTIYAYHPNPFFYVNGEKKHIAYRYIIEKAIKGEPVEIWGNPNRTKEVTYIDDLCQIFEKAIQSDIDGGMYNAGCGGGVSLEEQIKGIVEIFGSSKKSEIIYCPEKPDARQFIHDISKAQKELGFSPEYDYLKLLNAYKKEMEQQRFKQLWGAESDYE
jgi:UDP-glucose 4-epimerase